MAKGNVSDIRLLVREPNVQSEKVSATTPEVGRVLTSLANGHEISAVDALVLIKAHMADLPAICQAASALRDQGKGKQVSFSPKVFIPLTQMCRDVCGYCTFRHDPAQLKKLYMTPEDVLAVAREGRRLGCTEALFTLGERPEQRYPEARAWLDEHGFKTTLDYVAYASSLVLRETGMLPHANPGTMSRREMEMLRPVNASMGLMLESTSDLLYAHGGPHEFAPSKRPIARLKTIETAGQLKVPFTTGILIGIGETLDDRVDSLFAIKRLHEKYGHIQEVIIQNFLAKPQTPMASAPNAGSADMALTLAVTRLVLGKDMNVQAPPNLSPRDFHLYLRAGLNDWGGSRHSLSTM